MNELVGMVQGGKGHARKISFQGIRFEDVNNPIQIDQFYCPPLNCQNSVSRNIFNFLYICV